MGLAAPGPASLHSRVSKLIELVKPGGWIELLEADVRAHSASGPEAAIFTKMLDAFLEAGGIGASYASDLAPILEQAGMVNVQVKEFEVPYGATNPDKDIAEKGVGIMVLGAKGLSEGAKMMRDMGMEMGVSVEEGELARWPERLEGEIREKGTYFRILGVWGQKRGDE
jgi:hypothetical protein